MTRKTALQLLLCFVGYPALKAQPQPSITIDPKLTELFIPTTLSISFDTIKEIHLYRGDKKVVVKMDDIWEALADK